MLKHQINAWKTLDGWDEIITSTGIIVPFRPFKEARKFVHSLNLKNSQEWRQYCKSGNKPNDIPACPHAAYKNKGWMFWGDWLGTGYVYKKDFLPFKEARKFVHSLNLKNRKEWLRYCKSGNKPDYIPACPDKTYKKNWVSLGDWLGTGTISNLNKTFRPFKEARKFVHSLNLKNCQEWNEYCKSGNRPDDIPACPNVYKEDWVCLGDWLGTGTIASSNRMFRPFEKARKFVHSLNLKNGKEWRRYCKSGNKPDDIPARPNSIYKDKGWVCLGDWLGTGTVPFNRIFRPFEKARKFIRSLKLKSQKEWREYCKSGNKPTNIPSNPSATYKDEGWVGYGDWLGTGNVHKKDFLPFEEARKFVHSLKLKNGKEWQRYCKSGHRPDNIPSTPHTAYKNKGWIYLGDWLGINNA